MWANTHTYTHTYKYIYIYISYTSYIYIYISGIHIYIYTYTQHIHNIYIYDYSTITDESSPKWSPPEMTPVLHQLPGRHLTLCRPGVHCIRRTQVLLLHLCGMPISPVFPRNNKNMKNTCWTNINPNESWWIHRNCSSFCWYWRYWI